MIKIDDTFPNAPKYKEKIGVISQNMIDYNGYGWEIDKCYFDKVAEIVRRDPDFYEINIICISQEESKKENQPIIFAGFFKAENDYKQIKRYYSISTIDRLYDEILK